LGDFDIRIFRVANMLPFSLVTRAIYIGHVFRR